ncbi:hypothetical protein KOW79_008714 [Hemibagrus wyckioides]|uniref:Uncharacterized protein n=1 Tax=Hemibagrus wyckioides TaxID=337641 RepID=A0A9D3SPR1_9TELE|nr:hypothetical protein KOW79_008714 [Hemibagrus wyckioides]
MQQVNRTLENVRADRIDSREDDRHVQLAVSSGTRRGETLGSDSSPSGRVGLITHNRVLSHASTPKLNGELFNYLSILQQPADRST